MMKTKICWNCDYFQPSQVAVNRSGWCRRYAPTGADEKSVVDREYYDEFPGIKDGLLEWCGDFKPTAGTVVPAP
jgi:hypothetical protein